jgi:hypothetical protein
MAISGLPVEKASVASIPKLQLQFYNNSHWQSSDECRCNAKHEKIKNILENKNFIIHEIYIFIRN